MEGAFVLEGGSVGKGPGFSKDGVQNMDAPYLYGYRNPLIPSP